MSSTASQTQAIDFATVTEPAPAIEEFITQFLNRRPLPINLDHAIRYALLGSGKRLRPILTLQACHAVGGNPSDAMAPAAAIEMIHCFSLVHDDLPAMDNDDLRRGRPTLHRHTSHAMAILAGDAMMGLAFEMLATQNTPSPLTIKITRELASATNNMIAGQVYDTLGDGQPTKNTLEQLRTIHRHKTGALIRCACRMGAMCGHANEQQLDAITRYAEAIGLMFQVVDDLLDVTQTTEHLGKAANKDSGMGKLTYPGLLGIEQTKAEVVRLKNQALQALELFDQNASQLRNLCEYLAVRQK